MTKLYAILTSLVATLAVLVALLAVKQIPDESFGGASPGLYSTLGSSSQTSVGSTSVNILFTATVNCTARVISTGVAPIMLQFGSTTASGVNGHWQAASSTVIYDSELYGCGEVQAYGFQVNTATPSSTVGLIEFR